MYPAGGISASIYANRLRAEGMGSKEQAVLFSNQDYEALKQECVESGCLFEDPCFPAEPPSLGFKELAPYSSKTRDVQWMRPTVRKLGRKVYYEHIQRFVNDLCIKLIYLICKTGQKIIFTDEKMFLRHRLKPDMKWKHLLWVASHVIFDNRRVVVTAEDDWNSTDKHVM